MRRDDERPASCPPGLLSGDTSTLFAPPSTDSCSPVIVVDIRLCYYHAAFNLDEGELRPTELLDQLNECGFERIVVFVPPAYATFFPNEEPFKAIQKDNPQIVILDARAGFSSDALQQLLPYKIEQVYYLCSDEETANFVNQRRDCIVLPEQPLAELSRIDLESFYQHIKPGTPFMLCLDIDDTVLHLGMSIAFGGVRLNHNLFKFIDELLEKGYIFSVKFVTARCNYEELAKHEEYSNMPSNLKEVIERITKSDFSVSTLSELFQQRFPDIDFLGVSYSTFYSKKNGSYDKESYEKVKVLEGLKKKHGFPVVLIDNNVDELNPVYSLKSQSILGIQCFDIPCITNEQLLKLKNGRTFHEENSYRYHRRNCSI